MPRKNDPVRNLEIKKYINNVKIKGCEICGYNRNLAALSFDHLDPSTKYRSKTGKIVNPSELFNLTREYSFDTIKAEIEKCRLLCSNCHMEHTYPQNNIDLVAL